MNGNDKKRNNMQCLMTDADKQRIEWLASQEHRPVGEMLRVLILESLKVWELSHPGRSRRQK